MKSYTYSEARQNLATLLEEASSHGAVRIQRRDGQSYLLTPEPQPLSPLDVAGVTPSTPISRDDILDSIREGRRDYR